MGVLQGPGKIQWSKKDVATCQPTKNDFSLWLFLGVPPLHATYMI